MKLTLDTLMKLWKLILDSKWVIMLIISGISSVMANVSQRYTVTEQHNEIRETRLQVAAVANHYTKRDDSRKTQVKVIERIIERPSAKDLGYIIDDHVDKFH